MSPKPLKAPSYRLHKASRQAVVTLNGKDHYLGVHGSEASVSTYNRLVAEWQANGGRLPARNGPEPLTIAMLTVRYLDEHVTGWYVKHGRPTEEQAAIKWALRPLVRLYGDLLADEFGPRKLEAVRDAMIAEGWCRRTVNSAVHRVRRMFKWGVSRELVPVTVYQALLALTALQKGRCAAKERPPVKPVPDAHVDAIRPYVSDVVWGMIELQRITGMRPSEVCLMRGCDIDMTGPLWEYRPAEFKTEHHEGAERIIPLGPRAQAIIRPFLKTNTQEHLFAPGDAVRERAAKAGSHRRKGQKPTPRKTDRTLGLRYETDAYRRSVTRACKRAGVPAWAPNRLRHSAGTRIRRELGLEAAQVVLGHSRADVTQIYAERNHALAREIAAKFG